MGSDILVGAASIALADVLLWIGMPDKEGSPHVSCGLKSLR